MNKINNVLLAQNRKEKEAEFPEGFHKQMIPRNHAIQTAPATAVLVVKARKRFTQGSIVILRCWRFYRIR